MHSVTGGILLCRTVIGLNDTLQQLARCWDYAIEHQRILIADPLPASFGVPVLRYLVPFVGSGCVVWAGSAHLYRALNRYDNVVPPDLAGQVDQSDRCQYRGIRRLWKRRSTTRATFNFKTRHDAELIIHARGGGGERSITTLSRMAFRPEFARKIGAALSGLKSEYLAVHIRNTDMQTDYRRFFESIRPQLEGQRLLICSDDIQCKNYAKKYFRKTEVIESTQTPDTNGAALHGNPEFDQDAHTQAAFTDLMALAMAKEILVTETDRSRLSGFSRLALLLHQDRQLCDQLLTSATGADRVRLGFSEHPTREAPNADLVRPDLNLLPKPRS